MKMVTVKTFENYFSANILLTRLQDCGIVCFLKDEFTVTIDPILSNAIGGIKLQVREDQLTETMSILKSIDEEMRKTAVCPRCKKESLDYISKPSAGNIFTAIFTWLFSSYAVAPLQVYHCSSCGWESESLPQVE